MSTLLAAVEGRSIAVDSTPVPTDRVSWARSVAAEIGRLPAEQSTAIRLVYFQRLSLSEAGAQLGMRRRDLAGALARGLAALGAAIENQR